MGQTLAPTIATCEEEFASDFWASKGVMMDSSSPLVESASVNDIFLLYNAFFFFFRRVLFSSLTQNCEKWVSQLVDWRKSFSYQFH